MINLTKPLAVLGVAGAIAIAAVTPSEARSGRNAAAIGAGVAGFAVGAAVGAAATNRGYYGEPAYGYYGEPAPAYGYYSEPAYVDTYAYAPRRQYYGGDPSLYYAPTYPTGAWGYENPRERQLRGTDY